MKSGFSGLPQKPVKKKYPPKKGAAAFATSKKKALESGVVFAAVNWIQDAILADYESKKATKGHLGSLADGGVSNVPLPQWTDHAGKIHAGWPNGLDHLQGAFDMVPMDMPHSVLSMANEALKKGVPLPLLNKLLSVEISQYTFLHWKLFAETASKTWAHSMYAPETLELMKQGKYPPQEPMNPMKGPKAEAIFVEDLIDDDFWSDDEDEA